MPTDEQALILTISADIHRLEQQMTRAVGTVNTGSTAMERRAASLATRLNTTFTRINVREALVNVGNAASSALFERGAENIGVLGSALEPLGPAGLAAAAGIGAVALALEQARSAAEFARSLDDTANRLHVTTDELQIFRFGVREAGGTIEGADQALASFSVQIGRAKEGIQRSLQSFHALGFTPAEVRSWSSVQEALDHVIPRIAALRDAPQRDAIIAQLGLEGATQLMQRLGTNGADGMRRIGEEARAAGAVLDSELVRRGAEADREFERLAGRIQTDLRSAFINLEPVLVRLLGVAAQFADVFARIIDRMQSVENRTTGLLHQQQAFLRGQIAQDETTLAAGGGAPQIGGNVGMAGHALQRAAGAGNANVASDLARRRAEFADVSTELLRRGLEDADAAAHQPAGTSNLIPRAGTPHHPPQDTFAEQSATLDRSIAEANRALLQAILSRTGNISERAGIERQEIKQELSASQAQAAAEQARLDHARGITTAERGILQGKINTLRETQLAVAQQRDSANREVEAAALTQEQLEADRLTTGFAVRRRDAEGQLTDNAQDRYRLAIRNFEDQQRLELDSFTEQQNQLVLRKQITQAIADERTAALEAAQNAELAARRDQEFRRANPLFDFGHPLDSVNTDLQNAEVHGLQSLTDGLTDAITHVKSLGEAFHDISLSIIHDLVQIGVQRLITQPLANFLFGPGPGTVSGGGVGALIQGAIGSLTKHAGGTDFSHGGLAIVGDGGPELVNMRPGAQVLNNSILRQLAASTVARGGGVTVLQQFHLHAEGAVMTDELLASLDRKAGQAGLAAYTKAMRDMPVRMRQASLLGR